MWMLENMVTRAPRLGPPVRVLLVRSFQRGREWDVQTRTSKFRVLASEIYATREDAEAAQAFRALGGEL